MLFHSFDYAILLGLAWIVYWSIQTFTNLQTTATVRLQNLWLIVCSYIFYGWWDVRFAGLMATSTLVDYSVGRLMSSVSPAKRKGLMTLSVVVNLGLLGTFKYFNFFVESLAAGAESLGWRLDTPTLGVILPVGISFYTLQTLGYTIDVYRRRIAACHDAAAFFAYVAFFPQLVAGPIERASNMLPQFASPRRPIHWAAGADALRQILWGLFKKVIVADTCGVMADDIFARTDSVGGSTLMLGVIYFGFQIYGDFSGYSDIAIGSAKLFGITLMRNFDRPYFATSPSDFWSRWHISLSTWFRDYVYIPLGGNRRGGGRMVLNWFVVFTVSGLWHGAAANFVIWGWWHFAGLVVQRYLFRPIVPPRIPKLIEACLGWIVTMAFVFVGWTAFRIGDLPSWWRVLSEIASASLFAPVQASRIGLLPVALLVIGEIVSGSQAYPICGWFRRRPNHLTGKVVLRIVRWMIYLVVSAAVLGYLRPQSPFIYFQF